MLNPIVYILVQIIDLVTIALFFWVIISWMIQFRVLNTNNRFVHKVDDVLTRFFNPLITPIRRHMPDLGGVDISPIVFFLILQFVRYSLIYFFR